MNKLQTIGIISFRPNIEPLEFEFHYPNENSSFLFRIHYDSTLYDSFLDKIKGKILLETSAYVEIEEYRDELPQKKLFSKNIFLNHIEKMNYAIDLIRFSYKGGLMTDFFRIRNIGEQDFIYHKILINNSLEIVSCSSAYGDRTSSHVELEQLADIVPFEWRTFTRATDLLHLGFFNESLIVAFNLLDYCVQKTIKSLIEHVDDKEKEQLLRQIKEQRLKTYLGPLFKLLTGVAFYDKDLSENQLDKLNSKRNKIVHNGQNCTYEEVCESLKIIFHIISKLNSKGNQGFKIPLFLQ